MATSAALHSGADECSTLRRLRGNFEQSRDVRLLYAATTPVDSSLLETIEIALRC